MSRHVFIKSTHSSPCVKASSPGQLLKTLRGVPSCSAAEGRGNCGANSRLSRSCKGEMRNETPTGLCRALHSPGTQHGHKHVQDGARAQESHKQLTSVWPSGSEVVGSKAKAELPTAWLNNAGLPSTHRSARPRDLVSGVQGTWWSFLTTKLAGQRLQWPHVTQSTGFRALVY